MEQQVEHQRYETYFATGSNRDICGLIGKRNEPSFWEDCQSGLEAAPPLEVTPLSVTGPPANRVDLVFFADGYLESERSKFLDDAQRLANDLTQNQTFNTVKPLLNFWAAFSPSKESGIGVGGVPKDTVFGLYRDGTELRGVYCSKLSVAREACQSLGDRCNYPIVLGNDPFYGGIGGDVVTVTASRFNGPLVLRHELGHSIIDVGEEYDGGYAYWGVNNIQDLSEPVTWGNWLTNRSSTTAGDAYSRIERSTMPLQQYVWSMLNTTKPWSVRFVSSGTYSSHLVKFSLSGIPKKSSIKIELDGVDLDWSHEPNIGLDRWHYDIYQSKRLTAGSHELKFTLQDASLEGTAQLCSIEVLEYGDGNEFISAPGYYGLYPTYSATNVTTYRPTNDACLMRTVIFPDFCKVCMEGLWLSLLRRLNLIENVTETCNTRSDANAQYKVLEIEPLPLAQFRSSPVKPEESYSVTWKRNGKVLNQYENMTRIEIENESSVGMYQIDIKFTSEEIRADDAALRGWKDYYVFSQCP
ncbi:hypothetical protein FA15DRAFT_673501 [Coprinopsis marcescibilis]|uniref:IgA peptidase M64 n=1 Tax=Coprinopsis marcescibilis TaxID=230819 RepID=A0A5C3KJP1_COPMA|nr:hypothetical protein FA15DRAFT_673501 [Coprinopsis marcescibilis]